MNIQQIYKALEYGMEKDQAQKQLFSEARSPEKWEHIRTTHKSQLDELIKIADRYLDHSIEGLTYSAYRTYGETGSRKEYEAMYFDRRCRLNLFATLSLVYGDEKYLRALEDILWAICDEFSWGVPAHLDTWSRVVPIRENMFGVRGKIRGVGREHKNHIDLFAAETGFALSEILELLEERLSPLVVIRARKEIADRILASFCELNSLFRWETFNNNWTAVCAGSIGAAALYTIEDINVLVPLLHRVLGILECFLEGFEEDGYCVEGFSYWNYGFGFYVYFAELLKQKTSGRINLMEGEKIRNLALYSQRAYLSGGKVLCYSDAHENIQMKPGLLNKLKSIYPELQLPDRKYEEKFGDDHCYRWASYIRNFVWYNNEIKATTEQRMAHYFNNAQCLVARQVDQANTVCFSAIGAHNGLSHNHNDVGNFILHVNGETLLTDLGMGEYTAQYFGAERYDILCNGSQGHSVPIIDGKYQKAGHEHGARIINVVNTEEKDVFELDIAAAYEHERLKSLIRSFTFERTPVVRLLLTDSYTFTQKPDAIIERFITKYKPDIETEGIVVIKGNHAGVKMHYDSERLKCSISKVNFMSHRSVEEPVYLIDLSCQAAALEKYVCVRAVFDVEKIK